MEDIKLQIEEINKKLSEKDNKILSLENDLILLKKDYNSHGHTGGDGTRIIDSELNLKPEQPIKLGLGGIITLSNADVALPGSTSEQLQASFVSGKDMDGGAGQTTNNLQFNLLHQPQNASNQSFINAFRPPVYTSIPGTTVSVTAAGNTVTINGHNFTTDALAGALINIYNSSGIIVETQTIASNTSNIVTISDTWVSTTSGGTYLIFVPVFMGSADVIFQRFYTQEGTGGGIRFGTGVTNGGQNGLLYMDTTGDIFWRNKGGSSIKLDIHTTSSVGITRDLAAASGAVNTAHGLGRIPSFVKATAVFSDGTTPFISIGTYDGTNTNYISTYSGAALGGTTGILKLIPALGGNIQDAVCTVDATNVILTWTKTGSPTGTAYIIIESY